MYYLLNNKLSENIICRADTVMAQHKLFLRHNLKISDLAREIGTNRSYLSYSFKKEKGVSYNQYVNEFRIGHAKKIIYKGSMLPKTKNYKLQSIEEIGLESGFSSARNFVRQFKIFEGTTPSRYRKAVYMGLR